MSKIPTALKFRQDKNHVKVIHLTQHDMIDCMHPSNQGIRGGFHGGADVCHHGEGVG